MADISGFGLSILIQASSTFPAGVTITQFADDADSFDTPSQQINEAASGLNGHLVSWSRANPLRPTINVIPDGEDDRNLAVLFDSNRVARGRRPVRDVITMVVSYPNGRTDTYVRGVATDGPPGTGVASAGRLKSKAYTFAFEDMVTS